MIMTIMGLLLVIPGMDLRAEEKIVDNSVIMTVQSKTPNYVIDHFATGRSAITDEMKPVLYAIAGRITHQKGKKIELMGWVSDPPVFDDDNYNNQRNLAKRRAISVANWLIANGVDADQIVVYTVVGRGLEHPTNNFRDQRVDVYIVDDSTPITVKTNVNFQCPTGFTPKVKEDQVQTGTVITVNVTGNCVTTGKQVEITKEVVIEQEEKEKKPDACDSQLPPRHCDPAFYAHVLSGAGAGCAAGFLASNAEGGKGGEAGDARGGDGGDACGGNPGACIISGCVIGLGVGELTYEYKRAKKEKALSRQARRAEN
jgi:hypothetical protein